MNNGGAGGRARPHVGADRREEAHPGGLVAGLRANTNNDSIIITTTTIVMTIIIIIIIVIITTIKCY